MRLSLIRVALAAVALLAGVCVATVARADVPPDAADDVLPPAPASAPEPASAAPLPAPPPAPRPPPAATGHGLTLESVHVGLTAFVQDGHGYQSQAGRTGQAGSERLTVFEPQMIVVLHQGPRLTHRVWIPLDFVTAASPNSIDKTRPVDAISQASRQNEAGTVSWDATYEADARTQATFRNSLHLEEDFRSWTVGLSGARLYGGDDATVTLGGSHTYDWFDRLDVSGQRHGRANRATSNGSAGFTQILTPTTVVHANYGITLQTGELGNTWNAVPIQGAGVGPEILPGQRLRHAIVGRFAQWLPWNGALKGFYRFYADDWGIVAHTLEGQLLQRVSPWLYVRGAYRFHTQSGAAFFTTSASGADARRTADSDLDTLRANSVSAGAQATIATEAVGNLELGASLEHYVRSNDLHVDVAMWTTGLRF